jgi:hypothetical protein
MIRSSKTDLSNPKGEMTMFKNDDYYSVAVEFAIKWRRDTVILLAQIDYLTALTGESLDPEDAALVEQIRATTAL